MRRGKLVLFEIRLLGQFDLRQDDVSIDIPSRPARTLLAYLLLTRGTQHPRERLAGLLWPDSTESNARKNLRQALWHLRKAIGDTHLLVDTISIAFNSTPNFWLDIALLEDTADQDLETEASVYEGELLPGFYEDWILLERDRLNAAFERKMDCLLTQLLEAQRWTEVLDWAERWIAQGHVPEAAYRALMVSFAATGELSKVDEAYQRCLEALQQEVGVDPSRETADLHKNLLAGEKILRDPYAEKPGREVSAAPQRVNLPSQPTPFIGRKEELAEIEQLLADTRLLTLTGPGGIGKTRLAVKVASEVLDRFNNGVHFVSLSTIRSTDHIVQIIADALQFPLSSQEMPEDQLHSYLRNRQLLLVMDNFEHLLDGANIVGKILQAAPGLKILATSRERLELRGEITVNIGGLGFPDLGTSGDGLDYDAIELFVGSARRARPGFKPSTKDLEYATRICQMVQGMPLAIELAAAWLDTFSFEEIIEELQRSLDILSTEMRDVPDRHRNIRAVFDHSWSVINDSEREVFMRLSVFRGGFKRDAAQHVADASLKQLARLVRKSFLRHDPKTARFEIHELMRQYAEERLEENPQASLSAHDAHASYFASFMSTRWDHLRDGRQLVAINDIGTDIENVRTAWRYRVGQRDASRMRPFINSIRQIHYIRGWNYAARELFEMAVEALRGATDEEEAEAVSALAQAHQAFFMAWLGLAEQGYELARESVDTLEMLDRPKEVALALDGLNLIAMYLSRSSEEEQTSRRMHNIATEIDDEWHLAHALFVASIGAFGKRELAEARKLAESSLKISEQLGDRIGISFPLLVLGHVAIVHNEYGEARELYLRCAKVSEEVGFRWGIENSIKYLGRLALAMDEIAEAEAYFLRSLEVAEEIGLGRDLTNLIIEFARVRVAEGRFERAVELLALVVEHPASRLARLGEERIRDSALSLLHNLEVDLSHGTYAAAFKRG